MQGAMSILMLWQASPGVPMPQAIDTGIDVITQDNVDRYVAVTVSIDRAPVPPTEFPIVRRAGRRRRPD